MTIANLLPLLERPRRSGKGWTARCPAHSDRNPSLSVREGEKGILLRCWSGCSLEEICGSLGVTVKDLFYDNDLSSREISQAIRAGKRHRETGQAVQVSEFKRADTLREAEAVITAATGLSDTSEWPDEKRDLIMGMVADAILIEIREKGEMCNA